MVRVNRNQTKIALFTMLGVVSFMFLSNSVELFISRSSSIFKLYGIGIGGIAFLLLMQYRTAFARIAAVNWPVTGLLLYILLSVSWALDIPTSFQRVIMFVMSALVVIQAASLYTRDQVLRVLDMGTTIAVYVSALLAIAVPSVGQSAIVEHHGNSWSGLYGHRSGLALVCVAAIHVSMYYLCKTPKQKILRRRHKLWYWSKIFIAVATLIMANSKMALIAGVISLVAFFLIRFTQRPHFGNLRLSKGVMAWTLVVSFLLSPAIGIAAFPFVPELVGREDNLSGRTRFWKWGMVYSEDYRTLGSGYRSFWDVSGVNVTILQARQWKYENDARIGAKLANGHSGYYDTFFELGVLGCVMLAIFILGYVIRMIRMACSSTDPAIAFIGATFTFAVVRNLSETSFYSFNDLTWVLFLWGYLVLRQQGPLVKRGPLERKAPQSKPIPRFSLPGLMPAPAKRRLSMKRS